MSCRILWCLGCVALVLMLSSSLVDARRNHRQHETLRMDATLLIKVPDFTESPGQQQNGHTKCPVQIDGHDVWKTCPHNGGVCCVGHNTCCESGQRCGGTKDSPTCFGGQHARAPHGTPAVHAQDPV